MKKGLVGIYFNMMAFILTCVGLFAFVFPVMISADDNYIVGFGILGIILSIPVYTTWAISIVNSVMRKKEEGEKHNEVS